MDELLVECSIHLDGVPLKDVRTFKCGHGFCTTCIEGLFAAPSPFKCPTCRKRIQRKDGLQIFLNPHRLLTQLGTQSASRPSDPDNDLTFSDDDDLAGECVRKESREYTRLVHRMEQLQLHVFDVNKEHDELKVEYRARQRDYDVLEAQHIELKGRYSDLESQRDTVQRMYTDLQKKYEAATNDAHQWRQNCKKARADARKEKETQDDEMAGLVEREREFRHRAHAQKVACEKYRRKCEALRQEVEHLRRIQQVAEDPEDQSLLVVDRDAPDRLEHAADEDWLDEVCEVRGDRLDVESDYSDDSGKENKYEGEELRLRSNRRATEHTDDRERPLPEDRPRPAVHFKTEWNLESEITGHKRERETRKRKNQEEAVMGAPSGKLVKVSSSWGKVKAGEESDHTWLHQPSSSKMLLERSPWARRTSKPKFDSLALNLDSRGHLKGPVVLGSRRRFDKTS